ncbi:UvrD-helicase domain-containing protein [candidate division WOR-3 bacterium]|nr:UvrD-helicase domain-containing protein [candidate division WOR-3 bacterium]
MENSYVKSDDINLKIVEASAGSGKTTKLATEYLSLLFLSFRKVIRDRNPFEDFTKADIEEFRKTLNSIIAVTFSNLAANEMSEKILDNLLKFSDTENREEVIDRAFSEVSERCGLKSEEDRKKISLWSKFFLGLITNCYSDFNTGTIDALSASILRVISPEIKGINADFNFKDSLKNDLMDLTENFLVKKVADEWEEVEASLENILFVYRDNWDINLDRTLKNEIKKIFEKKKHGSKKIDIEKLKKKHIEKSNKCVAHGKNFYAVIKELAGEISNTTFSKGMSKLFLSLDENKDNTKTLLKIAEKRFMTEDPEYILNKKKSEKQSSEMIADVLKPFKKALKDFIELYSSLKLAALYNLTCDFDEFFSMRRKDKVYIYEIPRLIEDSLEPESLPYLYIKLSERYTHYLIDEFQDTSTAQLKMLAPLAGDAVLSKKGESSLFIVGDRKQAIYLWRGIEPGMLDQQKIVDFFGLRQSIIEGKSYKENLPNNFRSGGEIIEFNNSFWKEENFSFLPSFGLESLFTENYSGVFQNCGKNEKSGKGYVEINLVEKDGIYSAIDGAIRKIKEKGWENRDIAVLLRKNDNIKSLFEYLTEKGHECITEESACLINAPLVKEIVSFMKFLDFPPDNLSFYEFAKSSLLMKAADSCGIKYNHTDEIYYGVKKAFYTVFREKNQELWKQLVEPFFKNVGFMTAYDIFQDMIYRFKIYENFSESSFFLIKLGEILHDLENDRKTSISSFLAYTENIPDEKNKKDNIDIPHGENKVRLLTIHSSKGLEFENVILNLSESLDSGNDNISADEAGVRYIVKNWTKFSEKLKTMYDEKITDFNIGELNLLYVAMTRAKNGLYMVTERK